MSQLLTCWLALLPWTQTAAIVEGTSAATPYEYAQAIPTNQSQKWCTSCRTLLGEHKAFVADE